MRAVVGVCGPIAIALVKPVRLHRKTLARSTEHGVVGKSRDLSRTMLVNPKNNGIFPASFTQLPMRAEY